MEGKIHLLGYMSKINQGHQDKMVDKMADKSQDTLSQFALNMLFLLFILILSV